MFEEKKYGTVNEKQADQQHKGDGVDVVVLRERREDMAKIKRNAKYEKKREALKHDAIFSMAEIEDVLELIAKKL